jgi:hypothetical protein
MIKTSRLLFIVFLLTACALPVTPAPAATASPSPVPPSPTVAPSAPTATFVPSMRYFQNDFEREVTGWKTFTTSGEPGLFDLRVENGFWLFDLGGRDLRAFSLYPSETYKNVRLDLRLVNRSGTPYALNLICRYSEREGWYQFEVFNSGAYNLYYFAWDEESNAIPTLLAEGVSDAMRLDRQPNEIGVVCNGRDLSLYINGQLARAYPENQYVLREGWVGVGVASFDRLPILVALDWLKVTLP